MSNRDEQLARTCDTQKARWEQIADQAAKRGDKGGEQAARGNVADYDEMAKGYRSR